MWFRKKQKQNKEEKSQRVLDLEKLIGQEIEVSHLDLDIAKIEKGYLQFRPNNEFFYIGNNHYDYHIIFWDKIEKGLGNDKIQKRSAVKLIRILDGKEVYRNDSLPFEYKPNGA